MRNLRVVCVLLIGLVVPLRADAQQLKLDSLARLANSASQVIDVTVDEQLLQLASKFLSATRSSDEREIKELVRDLKGIYVKRFEFDSDGQFSNTDIEPILKQVRSSGWARIVGVTSAKQYKNIEVFIMTEGSIIKGLAIVAALPRELTVVNLVGPIDIDRLSRLQGQFGIPELDLRSTPR